MAVKVCLKLDWYFLTINKKMRAKVKQQQGTLESNLCTEKHRRMSTTSDKVRMLKDTSNPTMP